jgi:hypothetical protein
MTQDEIIEMARQAASHGVEDHRSGEISYVFYNEHLMNFAALVAAKEREACAKVCDDKHDTWRWDNEPDSASGPRDCAAAIRARGEQA